MSWKKSEDVFRLLSYPQGYFLSQPLRALTEKDSPQADCFGHWPIHALNFKVGMRSVSLCVRVESTPGGSSVHEAAMPGGDGLIMGASQPHDLNQVSMFGMRTTG